MTRRYWSSNLGRPDSTHLALTDDQSQSMYGLNGGQMEFCVLELLLRHDV